MKFKFLLCASAALLPAFPAFAQQRQDDEDIVVTATGIKQSVDQVGQAITVLDSDTIEKRQQVDVADLLATTPGVRFNRTGTTGSVTGVSLRGAETTQTLVLIDGVKVNDPSAIGDGFDFGNLLVGNIDRIEILRGSNSVTYGSQAIGGVVNVMTDSAETGFAAKGSADYGYRNTLDAKASVTGGTGPISGSAGVAYYDTDGISSVASQFGGKEKDGYTNLTANAKVRVAFTDTVNLDLRGYYINADLDYDSFFGAPADSPDITKSKQYVGYAGLNAGLFDGLLHNRVALTWFKLDRDYYFVRGNAPDYGYGGKTTRFEYQGVLQPVEQAKLIFGYEHEKPEYDFFGFGSTSTAKATTDSVYGLAVVQPFKGLSVTAGVRNDDHSQFGGATTFGANANYSPNDGDTNVRVSYGEGFKAPSLYQLYDTFSGTRTLKPERSQSYDVGVDQSFGDKVKASVTLFQRDTRDQINFSNATFTYGNLDRTRAKGAEVSLDVHPTDGLDLRAAYSYLDAKDRSAGATNGKRLARRAENAVSVSADYEWSSGLSTGATVSHVGDSFDNPANTRLLPAYTLVGVRASFPVTENLEIYGRIDNALDEKYSTAYGFGTFGRAAYAGIRVKLGK